MKKLWNRRGKSSTGPAYFDTRRKIITIFRNNMDFNRDTANVNCLDKTCLDTCLKTWASNMRKKDNK